jgi:hypothetical protein
MDARDGLHLVRLCEPCLKTFLASGSDGLAAFLNSINRPAALLDRDHTVLHSNSFLGRMLEKFDHDIVGRRIGEALECRYAAEGLGCGENEVCLHQVR